MRKIKNNLFTCLIFLFRIELNSYTSPRENLIIVGRIRLIVIDAIVFAPAVLEKKSIVIPIRNEAIKRLI
jgi:hypothetical protein|tara:strand:+ start:380 stop:589 length:210 start_codon:yes stop_codon:yes gene_type:complete